MSVNKLAIFVTNSDDCYQPVNLEGALECIEKCSLLKRKPLELVVLEGGGRGARHSLTAPHIVLGRLDPFESPTSGNLLFPEPTVSRLHATLDWDEAANRYLLTHRSATNLTLVNKIKVSKPRHIAPGDKIQLGNLVFEIRLGIGQHAEVELETVDFTALTKKAANQVYRPEMVMPEPPAMPAAAPQPPVEAPIPAPIPPPARRQIPAPVFLEPYAPFEVAAPAAAEPFFEFPEPDEQVSVALDAPRRIQLSSLPLQEDTVAKEPAETMVTAVLPSGLFGSGKKPAFLPLEPVEEVPEDSAPVTKPGRVRSISLSLSLPEVSEEDTGKVVLTGLPEVMARDGVSEQTPEPCDESILDGPRAAEKLADGVVLEVLTEAPQEPGGELVLAEPEPDEEPKSKPIRREAPKVGRNKKCPCGSGKKFKKCCGS